jgi:pimeloyl-ACP methyl ester carboxylesterase
MARCGRSGCWRILSEQRRRSDPKARNRAFHDRRFRSRHKTIHQKQTSDEMTEFKSEKTLLFVHGASQPAEGTFDLPLEGLSWMDYVDRRGWDVYLVDVRGYGASTRPPEMDQPPANNPPIATTDVAIRDLRSAVDFIIHRRSLSKINLMGWSWGTVITAAYAADHPDKVERLVLYGPTWVRAAPPAPNSRPLGAYLETPMSRSRDRMQAGAPEDRKNELMPSSWFGSASDSRRARSASQSSGA